MNNTKAQKKPLVSCIREATLFVRTTAWAVIISLLSTIMLPAAVAATMDVNDKAAFNQKMARQTTPEGKLNQVLIRLQELTAKQNELITKRVAEESGITDDVLDFFGLSQLKLEDTDELKELSAILDSLNMEAIAGFDKIEAEITDKGLPKEILQRHHETVVKYKKTYADMRSRLRKLLNAASLKEQGVAVESLHELLKAQKLEKQHNPIDPENLPWSTPDADKTRKPADTESELRKLTGIRPNINGVRVASNIITPDMLGQFGGPVETDLTETTDIQFTDAIRNKAIELGEDPVKIYNWVRNNIGFVPTYGSIQGADYTLEVGQGNAFDTASLLIALLRASNIPARYSYGTVEIPVEQVQNWVGDVKSPQAAQQILGQGGIPNTGLAMGGSIKFIRMEHVWVEAWVDYFPSQGAKHKVGDSWIPLDASYKQYNYVQGFDYENDVPFDAAGLMATVNAQLTIDPATGSVSGPVNDAVNSAMQSYQEQLKNYIDSQGAGLYFEQVFGAKKTIKKEVMQLSSGLPYEVKAKTNGFSAIPDELRYKVQFTLQQNINSYGFTDVMTHEFLLPEIAGKKLSLSYAPASEADGDVIRSLIPPEGATEADIITNIPSYLIKVVPELNVGKEIVATSGALQMGTQTNHKMRLYSPSRGWSSTDGGGVAGEYRAIGVNPGKISGKLLNDVMTNVNTVQERIANSDFTGLEKHDLTGPLIQGNILSYFAMNDLVGNFQQKQYDVTGYTLPSYGYFFTSLQTSYLFGIPRTTHTAGFTMDVPYLSSMGYSNTNDRDVWLGYNSVKGMVASYLENWIPEFLLSSERRQQNGVSAVKLLNQAMQTGQKVYVLNQANQSLLSNIQIGSSARQDIYNALNAGKNVTVHEAPLDVNGWSGSGYIIFDPNTGSGAYMISGGANGGAIADEYLAISSWMFGAIDGGYGQWSEAQFGRAMYSDTLRQTQVMLKYSEGLGYIGLGISIVDPFVTSDYSIEFSWDAVGKASFALLGFALTAVAVTAIAASTTVVAGIVAGAIVAAGIGYAFSALSGWVFGD